MNDYIDASDLGFDEKFAIGQPVPRSEDPVLLRGEGHYSDDVSLAGQAYAVMLRSAYAHGVVRRIDATAARAMPGVLAIYTAADLAKGGIGPLPPRQVMNNRDGTPMRSPVERLVETAAAEMGIDRVALRRRNHIPPSAMPYKAPNGTTYDSGDFTGLLDQALALADWDGFPARQAESRSRGKLRGRGISDYLELTGPPGREMGGIRFAPDGTVTIITGTLDYGQGHASPFAQVLATRLGIPFRRIRLLQGDSDQLIAGGGTGGSKSMIVSGNAIVGAADKVIEAGRQIAAHVLEAAAADIEFHGGRFVIAGTDRSVGLMELAAKIHAGLEVPPGLPQSLDVADIYDGPPSAFPNGCHIAEVEVDPETGMVEVVKYAFVNDFGVVINPLLVDGQAHGGIVQGIGQALRERTVYDANGQLLTGSYMDYAMPRADDAPRFVHEFHPVPATTNPLGAKGCGEAGCAGALPSVMNALVDALDEFGIRHIDMPATPERVWRAIRDARN